MTAPITVLFESDKRKVSYRFIHTVDQASSDEKERKVSICRPKECFFCFSSVVWWSRSFKRHQSFPQLTKVCVLPRMLAMIWKSFDIISLEWIRERQRDRYTETETETDRDRDRDRLRQRQTHRKRERERKKLNSINIKLLYMNAIKARIFID